MWLRVSQDIDFVGSWDPMIPDAEIISLLATVMTKLEVGEFAIKVRWPSSPTYPSDNDSRAPVS